MAKQKKEGPRSVFEISKEEAEARLKTVSDNLKKEIFAKGLPILLQDGRCPTKHHYIEKYEDGRMHLVYFDIPTKDFIFVKDLTNA